MTTKVFILLAAVVCSVTGAFPNDPKPCKYGDAECIGKLFNYFVQEKYEGDDNIDLTVIDPLPIRKMQVSRGEDSPVNVKFQVTEGQAEGIKTFEFVKLKGFGKDIAVNHEIVSQAKYLRVTGDCSITGKVLILPIHGTGKCNISMAEPKFTLGWTGVPYEKDGATYMKIKNFYVDMEPKSMSYFFSNLYNDKALSDNMNKFLTENWSEIYPEIRTPLNSAFGGVIRKVVSSIFAKYPYEKFFIDSN